MRTASFLALALAVGLTLDGRATAQPKGPTLTALELYGKFRDTMAEGKYDIAGIYLEEFLKVPPSEKDYLKLDKDYGPAVFEMLRAVPRYSDDPATEKKIRANVEEVNRQARAAVSKQLETPQRVKLFVTNLGKTHEEKVYAQQELKRTGEYAVPFLIDALRSNPSGELSAGILDTIPVLDGSTMAGWVASLDSLTPDHQYGVLKQLAGRRDVLRLLAVAQTDFTPQLWRILSRPRADSPGLYDLAQQLHNDLIPGAKADAKRPEVELTALARKFYDHKAIYLNAKTNPDGSPTLVPVWVTTVNGGVLKLDQLKDVPVSQAEEYYGLRYARWALEKNPEYEPAQQLVLSLAAERAVERSRFGNLAVAEPDVYRLLTDAPSRTLGDLLARGLAEKRTTLVFATLQALGDRADRDAATPPAGAGSKPSLLVRALAYPDHAVQFAAASALLRSPVPVTRAAKQQIVDILRRAAGTDAGKPADAKGTVLLADPGAVRATATAAQFRGPHFNRPDDDPRLKGLALEVETVTNGRDLLRRIARASDFDLIVIDYHTANPELIDLVSQIQSDPRAAGRPVFVVASADKPHPPTFDQLLLRTAALLAATDTGYVPNPYSPDPRATPEEQAKARAEVQAARDAAFLGKFPLGSSGRAGEPRTGGLFSNRLERLRRVIDTLPLTLTDAQKRLMDLRMQLVTYAILAAEFPLTPLSAPETVAEFDRARKQVAAQPASADYGSALASADLMKVIERFELNEARAKDVQDRYDAFRAKVDPVELGLKVETYRDEVLEARLSRLLRNYPEVRVIPEPYSRSALEAEFRTLFADPMLIPRDGAVKKADARAAVEFLRQMATGDLPGYDLKSVEGELRAALTNPDPDVVSAAIDAVERFKNGESQVALLQLAVKRIGSAPPALRRKAADAVIRHIRANGKAVTPELVTEVNKQIDATNPAGEKDAELRGKFLTLKGMLTPEPGDYPNQLKGYNPPIVRPLPAKEPDPKKEPAPLP